MDEHEHQLVERVDQIEEHLTSLEAGLGTKLRTQRLQVVDEEGCVRVEIGLLGPALTPDEEVRGVVVKNDRGRDRLWMVTVGDGNCASIGLDFEGETVASLSVGDHGEVNLLLGEDQ